MRFNSLSQLTRSSREAYRPGFDPQQEDQGGLEKTRVFAPPAKLSEKSFSAPGGMASLKDRWSTAGTFKEGSVKDNWRPDGGLSFASGKSVKDQTDSTEFIALSMDPLKPFGGKKKTGVSDNSLMDTDLGDPAGVIKMLDDLVFAGDMTADDMSYITRVLGRRNTSREVIS